MLPDGTCMGEDEFRRMAREAEVVEVTCPDCGRMTCSEDLGGGSWLCYECGKVYDA